MITKESIHNAAFDYLEANHSPSEASECQAAMNIAVWKAFMFAYKLAIKDISKIIKSKWLYRLESTTPDNGLWYDSKGEYCFGIGKLKDCKTKDLPMGYDERYRADGRMWYSSCSNKEDLLHWYSLEDAKNLIANGFVFKKYLATEYTEYPMETVFIKDSCLAEEVIDINTLFE